MRCIRKQKTMPFQHYREVALVTPRLALFLPPSQAIPLSGDLVQSPIAPDGSSHPEKNCGAVKRKIIRFIKKAYTEKKERVFNSEEAK